MTAERRPQHNAMHFSFDRLTGRPIRMQLTRRWLNCQFLTRAKSTTQLNTAPGSHPHKVEKVVFVYVMVDFLTSGIRYAHQIG